MKRIAIIGTRNPTEKQITFIRDFISKLTPEKCEIISGCCTGVDEIGLSLAKARGIRTIGVIPWKSYNPDIQKLCDVIISDKDLDAQTKEDAMQSVYKYHPKPEACSHGAKLLHSRNYIIVYKADVVLACPKDMSGGTMQGVRIVRDLDINLILVDNDGNPSCQS